MISKSRNRSNAFGSSAESPDGGTAAAYASVSTFGSEKGGYPLRPQTSLNSADWILAGALARVSV